MAFLKDNLYRQYSSYQLLLALVQTGQVDW